MKVLSRLYRRLFLTRLQAAFDAGQLRFFGDLAHLDKPATFTACLRPLRAIPWVVYAKRPKVMTLDAGEFIRRFLLHVLPDGFHRIRHYGYLANGHRLAKLACCRRLLALPEPAQPVRAADYRERYQQLTGRSLDLCPCCGGRMIEIGIIPRAGTAAAPWNTS